MPERRLAAILAADVAGFSAAMARDEDGTLATLQVLRAKVDPIIVGHGGRIASTAGDSVIAEFGSVAEAVDAAVEVQRATATGALVFRIGVNLGDVIAADDGDVFGDGVNIAARLEAIAEPGGITISGSVRDSLRGRSPVEFEDAGSHQLKNIDEPVRVYRAVLDAVPDSSPQAPVHPTAHPELLERAEELDVLRSALDRAAAGSGGIVVAGGEAGIGKSSLVRAFASEVTTPVLWGWCEDLLTPRALGPFHDMAPDLGSGYRGALAAGDAPERVLAALRADLAAGPARLMVIEDLHWADDATVDAVKYLARRIDQLPVLLVLTVRDTGLGRLRAALASAGHGVVTRVQLAPLSAAAIAALAGETTGAERLRRLTSGNPFLLSEVLAAGGDVVPASVQDAVLARVDELSSEARRAVELVSVVPTRLERDIARGIVGGEDGQAEAEAAQLLTIRPEGVGFRHELARRAVESGLTGQVRRSLNEAVLAALERQGADPARLVHHAAEAADDEAVVRHGLEAARSAAAALANRQALAHWSRVLEHEGMLTETQLEEALEGHSRAAYLSYENERALASREQLLAMHETGDPRARSTDHRWISRLHWMLGNPEAAAAAAAEAARAVEHLPTTPELAMAYSARSQLAMLAYRDEEAIEWGERAIDLATSVDDIETVIHAKTNVGTSLQRSDHARSSAMLEEAAQQAVELGYAEHACRAMTNLNHGWASRREYGLAEPGFREAIAFAAENEVEIFVTYLSSLLGIVLLETGQWEEAWEVATRSAGGPAVSSPSRVPAIETLARLAGRRGRIDEGLELAQRAWALAEPSREVMRMGPAADARAEVYWLADKPFDEIVEPTRDSFALARARGDLRYGGALATWMQIMGDEVAGADFESPYDLELAGRFGEAASRWDELGVPYEAALATWRAGEKGAALDRLDALGAIGTIDRLRRER